MSFTVEILICITDVPPPEVTVLHVGSEVVSLGLAQTGSLVGCKLHIDYTSDIQRGSVIREDSCSVDVEGLNPGIEYTFSITRITENGNQSRSTTVSVFTGKFGTKYCFFSC